MNPHMTALENAVIDRLTSGDLPELDILRQQWQRLTVVSRHRDGRGFWLILETPPDCPRVARLSTQLGDVSAQLPELELGIGFDLWVTDGAISSFEGATYEGFMPSEIGSFTLGYLSGRDRDWEYVRRVMAGGSTEWPPMS